MDNQFKLQSPASRTTSPHCTPLSFSVETETGHRSTKECKKQTSGLRRFALIIRDTRREATHRETWTQTTTDQDPDANDAAATAVSKKARTSRMTHGLECGTKGRQHTLRQTHRSCILAPGGHYCPCMRSQQTASSSGPCLFEQQLTLTLIIRMRASLSPSLPSPRQAPCHQRRCRRWVGDRIDCRRLDQTERQDKCPHIARLANSFSFLILRLSLLYPPFHLFLASPSSFPSQSPIRYKPMSRDKRPAHSHTTPARLALMSGEKEHT